MEFPTIHCEGYLLGEARRHARLRAAAAPFCHPMNRHRFNLYTIGTRHSKLYRIFREVSRWCSPDERIIASAGRDLSTMTSVGRCLSATPLDAFALSR